MRSCLGPSYSEWKPSTSLLYTIAEARKDLGLFDDTSFDSKLSDLIKTAQEYASNIVDGPISSTERVDYYPCLARSMVLSWKPDATASLSIAWQAESGAVAFADIADLSTSSTDFNYDASDGPPAVVFTESGETRAEGLLASDPLSDRIRNAVNLTYSAGVTTQGRGTFAPKQAVMDMVLATFQQDGQQQIGAAAKQQARDILGPYERMSV